MVKNVGQNASFTHQIPHADNTHEERESAKEAFPSTTISLRKVVHNGLVSVYGEVIAILFLAASDLFDQRKLSISHY